MLTSSDTISCLGRLEVTHQAAVPEIPGSISGSDNDFCSLFCFVVIMILRFGPESIMQFCNYLCNDNLFSTLNILQHS